MIAWLNGKFYKSYFMGTEKERKYRVFQDKSTNQMELVEKARFNARQWCFQFCTRQAHGTDLGHPPILQNQMEEERIQDGGDKLHKLFN